MESKMFSLQLSKTKALSIITGVSGIAAYSLYEGLTNTTGEVTFFVVEPQTARMIYGVAAAIVGLIFLPCLLVNIWFEYFGGHRIVFTPEGVWLPRSNRTSQHVLVPYDNILHLKRIDTPGVRALIISWEQRKFLVSEMQLREAQLFDEIYEQFQAYVAPDKFLLSAR